MMEAPVNDKESLRLFIAIPLPEMVTARLARQSEELRSLGLRARWVKPENMHLTLRFIGGFPRARVDALDGHLRRAVGEFSMLEMQVKGIGVFPSVRRPSVLWAGLAVLSGALPELQASVEGSVRAVGMATEDKPFSAHVTLARFRGSQESLQAASVLPRLLTSADICNGQPFAVRRVHLVQSTLTPAGPLYQNLREYCLS